MDEPGPEMFCKGAYTLRKARDLLSFDWNCNGKSMHGVAWLRPEPRRSGIAIYWTAKQWNCKEKHREGSAAMEL